MKVVLLRNTMYRAGRNQRTILNYLLRRKNLGVFEVNVEEVKDVFEGEKRDFPDCLRGLERRRIICIRR
jgi:hypothetical protein